MQLKTIEPAIINAPVKQDTVVNALDRQERWARWNVRNSRSFEVISYPGCHSIVSLERLIDYLTERGDMTERFSQ